MVPEEGCTRS